MKEGGEDRLEHATYQPGDYGRMIRPDGTEQWWVRFPQGPWSPHMDHLTRWPGHIRRGPRVTGAHDASRDRLPVAP